MLGSVRVSDMDSATQSHPPKSNGSARRVDQERSFTEPPTAPENHHEWEHLLNYMGAIRLGNGPNSDRERTTITVRDVQVFIHYQYSHVTVKKWMRNVADRSEVLEWHDDKSPGRLFYSP